MYFNVPTPNKLSIPVKTTLGGVFFAVTKIRLYLLFGQCAQQNQDGIKGKEVFLFKLRACL